MPLLHFPSFQLRPPRSALHFHPIAFSSSSSSSKPASRTALPARDRVIDFGRHKGRMLGSLPSSYLHWVSSNLRFRDFNQWAILADEVLRDPVYRDRLEWESASRLLSGEGRRTFSDSSSSAVSDLIEMSGRFGWDNEDKDAWARIDFDLLGTSFGGRIPRIGEIGAIGEVGLSEIGGRSNERMKGGILRGDLKEPRSKDGRKDGILRGDSKVTNSPVFRNGDLGSRKNKILSQESKVSARAEADEGKKVKFLRNGYRYIVEEEKAEEVAAGEKIEERRERRKIKRQQQMEMVKKEIGVDEKGRRSDGIHMKIGSLGNGGSLNPFPGRGALLDKIKRQGD
ncbi:uncharacterized protein [Typha angustifolia]|uniref:uncharacterized protein n=1 Tax=Typha angustifolia TaxID=59011 RepID=UPI003C2EC767